MSCPVIKEPRFIIIGNLTIIMIANMPYVMHIICVN